LLEKIPLWCKTFFCRDFAGPISKNKPVWFPEEKSGLASHQNTTNGQPMISLNETTWNVKRGFVTGSITCQKSAKFSTIGVTRLTLFRLTFNVYEALYFLDLDPLAHGVDHPADRRVIRQNVGVIDAVQAKRLDSIFVISSRANRAFEEGHFNLLVAGSGGIVLF
jgi:hypothetical protein